MVGDTLEDGDKVLTSVSSYDPRTNRWSSELPLPLGDYQGSLQVAGLRVVAHEGRLVVAGIKHAPPLALAGDVRTELRPLPPRPFGGGAAGTAFGACMPSTRLG